MDPWLTKIIVGEVIRRVREKRMKKFMKGVKWVSVIALAVGSLSQTLGLDLAPEQVDIVANGLAIIGYAVVKLIEARKAAE